jgi:hypothetical protein
MAVGRACFDPIHGPGKVALDKLSCYVYLGRLACIIVYSILKVLGCTRLVWTCSAQHRGQYLGVAY